MAEPGPPHVATNRSASEQPLPYELTASNRPIDDIRCAELVAPKQPLGQVIARHCGIPRADAVDYDAQVPAHIVTFGSLLGQEQETIHELVDG